MGIYYLRLGPRDENRFAALPQEEQETLAFKVDFFLNILQKRPLQPEALRAAADALTTLGYYEDGLQIDQRLARLFPDDETVQYNLACSYALTNKPEEAFITLQAAVDLGYDDASCMRNDPDLQSLKNDPRFRQILQQCRSATKQVNVE